MDRKGADHGLTDVGSLDGRIRRQSIDDFTHPILPKPEVVLLLDEAGQITRVSNRYSGERLAGFTFEVGVSPHEALHPGCSGLSCRFMERWREGWDAHQSMLPVQWIVALPAKDARLKFRLQRVAYACGVLFGEVMAEHSGHSVLFVTDESDERLGMASQRDNTGVKVVSATIHPSHLATDPSPDLVAALDNRLRTVTSRLLVAQEIERKRISAELHDGLGQTLSLLKLELEGLCAVAGEASLETRTELARATDHATRALKELRQITRNLRPTVMAEMGLRGALEILEDDFRAHLPKVNLSVEIDGDPDALPDDLAITLYRIAQEALNNIARHSNATSASLRCSSSDEGVELLVSDDGDGVEAGSAQRHGLGLITMRERAESLGGSFKLDSRPGHGCTVRASWITDAMRSLL